MAKLATPPLTVPIYARLHIPKKHVRCNCSPFHLPLCVSNFSSDLGKVEGCTLHNDAVGLDLKTRAETRPRESLMQSLGKRPTLDSDFCIVPAGEAHRSSRALSQCESARESKPSPTSHAPQRSSARKLPFQPARQGSRQLRPNLELGLGGR